MRKILTILTILLLVQFSATVSALEDCPTNVNAMWTDCVGTYNSDNGDQYSGEWKDNKRTGQGTYTYSDGEQYSGEFKDDKKHGQGTYTWADGPDETGMYSLLYTTPRAPD